MMCAGCVSESHINSALPLSEDCFMYTLISKDAKATSRLLSAGADMGALSLSAGASECTSCLDYSDSPTGSSVATNCTCNAGYTGSNGGTCTACTAGKYKPAAGACI